ncbi:MAG: molybdopterin biosynthesis protein [Bacillota bacterium]|nr:molybdopterin biosynthesis protein [Bacillota bacterium]
MSFQYLNNVTLKEAKKIFKEKTADIKFETETLESSKAFGRVTAAAVYANISAPHYLASAMDGIATYAHKTFQASDTNPIILNAKDYTVVDTGDPIPNGMDCVIMVEELVHLDDGQIKIHTAAAPWQNIRQIGEDICAGEMIVPSYTQIDGPTIGAMLAAGVMTVEVLKKKIVGIIPTGDEVVAPTQNPKPGDVIEFNSSIFTAMLSSWGAQPITYEIVKDKKELIKAALEKALSQCDIVLINAGSSAGRDDYTSEIISELGEVFVHGVSIKPGKPVVLGLAKGKPVIGVPGYPVSGIIALEEFVKPLVTFDNFNETAKATLSKSIVSGLKYKEYVRVRLGYVNGKLVANPLPRGAGVVSSFMKADGILEVPLDCEGIEAGEEVTIRLLKPLSKISNSLVAIGSHDPLLDELSDMLHRQNPKCALVSSHVGSMGGLMALKRGESHFGGTHMLDEADGTYNVSYIHKQFPDGGVKLLECVYRVQGLMVAKGNPLGIKGVEDITKLRYVNRQKGSGTRILIDYLLKKGGINSEDINGYEREETTHTAVAAQIAAGTADAGMGIYSAAKIYDLDFIPICLEQYDLLVSDQAYESKEFKELLSIIKSEQFKNRLEELGGYELHNPGAIRAI